ncbi:MAG: hypothetical protein U0Q15_10630 [Kineosporiaceae bacterium]
MSRLAALVGAVALVGILVGSALLVLPGPGFLVLAVSLTLAVDAAVLAWVARRRARSQVPR